MTLFTGSQQVADKLTADMKGRVKLEDAGFDWKILGPYLLLTFSTSLLSFI